MALDVLPEHLVIVGGSYIGLEFAQMYRRYGSRVTVIEQGARLVAREDDDVSDCVLEILENEGIEIRLSAACIAVDRWCDGVAVSTSCAEGSAMVTGSHLLLAIGRRPNIDGLGLTAAGIATDARGYIQVDDQLRTSVPGVWAVGDVNGRGSFTHTSWHDHEVVPANPLDGESRRVTDRIAAYALFIDPPRSCGIDRARGAQFGQAGVDRTARNETRRASAGPIYPAASIGVRRRAALR